MKIVLLDAATFGDADLRGLNGLGEIEIFQDTAKSETLKRTANADIVITNKVVFDKEILTQSKNLKFICVAATGVNNIDLERAKELGIGVSNASGYSSPSVICHTFSMLFYLLGHSGYYNEYTKGKKWCKSNIFTHLDRTFYELEGKQWGIIGLGTIGQGVAKTAESFGCKLSYYSTSGKNLNQPFRHAMLDELLKNSDIISIHSPLNERTNNLIDLKKLHRMKRNAILLNLGRGGIVNEKDLAIALDEELIMAAGLDVLQSEPPDANNPLFHIKNPERIFLTPHIAWASCEARKRLVDEVIKNVQAFQRGKERNRLERL